VIRQRDPRPESAILKSNPLANPVVTYPFLGTVVCLVALGLLTLPWILNRGAP
jgi:hypothetical protein